MVPALIPWIPPPRKSICSPFFRAVEKDVLKADIKKRLAYESPVPGAAASAASFLLLERASSRCFLSQRNWASLEIVIFCKIQKPLSGSTFHRWNAVRTGTLYDYMSGSNLHRSADLILFGIEFFIAFAPQSCAESLWILPPNITHLWKSRWRICGRPSEFPAH